MADGHSLAGMTAAYYALTYIGFAAPYLLSRSTRLTGYPALLVATAALALATAALVSRRLTGDAVTVVPVGPRS